MISRQELNQIKEQRKTTLFYEEKEYLQYLFLHQISKEAEHFVFKGGTCLRICYGSERASEDLDFNTDLSPAELKKKIATSLKGFTLLNIPSQIYAEKELDGNIRLEVRFQGPLFQGNPESTNTLKIDFNKKKVKASAAKVIPKLFSDVPQFTILILAEPEILAEKIRALLMRMESRDAYDVWLLLNKGIKIDSALLRLKLREEKVLSPKLKFPSMEEYRRDLQYLLRIVPPYEQIKKEITAAMKGIVALEN